MFVHTHPYPPYIPTGAKKLIVGTLPPPRFTTGDLKPDDVDFCYGSRDGLLWPILSQIFDLGLKYETTAAAITQRKDFLIKQQIGICDIVAEAKRDKIDASDLGMQQVVLRDLVGILKQHPSVDTLLFTGGNSKNGPEYFFRRHLKSYGLSLELQDDQVPRRYLFKMPDEERIVNTVSLTAPSGSANRAIGSISYYKMRKAQNPNYTTLDFRIEQYTPYFKDLD